MPVHSKPVIGSGPEPFQISWPTEFWDDRNPLEAKPHVQHRLELALTPTSLPTGEVPSPPDPTSDAHPPEQNSKDEPNHLQLFLRAYDDDEPTIQEEEITDFCEGVHPSVLKQADRGQRTSAWLDDRLYSIYCELGPIKYPIPNSEASTKRVQAAPMGLSSPSPGRGWDDSTSEDATSCSSTKTASATLLYRKYNPPLSASALYEHLMAKVRYYSAFEDGLFFQSYALGSKSLVYPAGVSLVINSSFNSSFSLTSSTQQFGHPELPDADRRLM